MKAITPIPNHIHMLLKEGKGYRKLMACGINERAARFWSRLASESETIDLDETDKTPEMASTNTSAEYGESTGCVTTRSCNIHTVEQALEYSKVDLAVWEVDRSVINSWEVTMGRKNTSSERPETFTNYQVKVWLRRKCPCKRGLEDFLLQAANAPKIPEIKRVAPKLKKKHRLMAEIGLYDHHFGMRAWGNECGKNYDLKIASSLYKNAVDYFIDAMQGYEIEKILFPIGNDLFHVNDQFMETPSGKNQLDVDGRISKIITVATEAVVGSLKRCLEVADTEVIWIPGNHDPLTSLFMVHLIKAQFSNNENMTVDTSENERKYRVYGPSLLGFNHGDKIKPKQLPFNMIEDRPKEFAESTTREWHIGHTHKINVIEYNVGEQLHACRIRTLASLCRQDSYAHGKGFPKAGEAAECYLWHRENGYHGHLNAPSDILQY